MRRQVEWEAQILWSDEETADDPTTTMVEDRRKELLVRAREYAEQKHIKAIEQVGLGL